MRKKKLKMPKMSHNFHENDSSKIVVVTVVVLGRVKKTIIFTVPISKCSIKTLGEKKKGS